MTSHWSPGNSRPQSPAEAEAEEEEKENGGRESRGSSLEGPGQGEGQGHGQGKEHEQGQPRIVPLCGYLHKLSSSRGLLSRAPKRRWFVFSDSSCKLFVYRSRTDTTESLGEVDIARATFSYDAANTERPGMFYISTPERTYELQARDRQTCLFWLQELQKRRRDFSRLKSNVGFKRDHSIGKTESGLLSCAESVAGENDHAVENSVAALLIDRVERPSDLTCETEAGQPYARSAHRAWSFTNLRDHVVNSVSGRKSSRQNFDPVPSAGGAGSRSSSQSPSLTLEDGPQAVGCDVSSTDPVDDPVGGSARRISALRRKFTHSFKAKDTRCSPPVSESNFCKNCHQSSERASRLQEDLISVEDQLLASREVIRVLQQQLDFLARQRDTLIRRSSGSEEEEDLLTGKDREIVELLHHVRKQSGDNEELNNKLVSCQEEVVNLRDQLDMYQEAVNVKDGILVQLTDRIAEMEDCDSLVAGSLESPNQANAPSHEMDTLRDSLQAFKLQNRFLNNEILELNLLRAESEDRESKLIIRCSDWEARYYQVQSKYLLLLNHLHLPHKGEEEQRETEEVVSHLIQDALDGQSGPRYGNAQRLNASESEYDEFGFCRKKNDDSDDDLLVSRATNLLRRSEDIKNMIQDPESEQRQSRWENLVVSISSKELGHIPELKSLLRNGIPSSFRGQIWKECVEMRVKGLKDKLRPGYYHNLLATHCNVNRLDPAAKQIELDLLRTLPNNKHYEMLHSDGIPRLRRVLLAYSWHNSDVGYCQGLNRLAAIALLFMNEEDAFWCLVAIVELIMPPDYYSKTLMASQVDQRVLKDLVAEKLPRLHSHLEETNMDLSLFTFNWFLCVFVDNLPIEVYLRVWDTFLYEGSKVLFRYTLAFLKMHEDDLVLHKDCVSINRFFRTTAEGFTDIKRFVQIAFHDLNPFPMRTLKAKRNHHLQIVRAELAEMEQIRKEFRSRSLARVDVDSDEDNIV